jgi:hypothetical protein
MTATITFFADEAGIQNLSGSGLGFYGSTFGNSVEVGAWQDSTYITDGNGVTEGPSVHNIKWAHPASGEVNGGDPWNLLTIPNRLATLEIRFENDTAVKTQNAKLRIFDRSNINNAASGVTTKVVELIHPDINQAAANGSGDSTWNTPAGSAVIMDLAPSPGLSGLSPNGPGTTSTIHSWFTAISASPDSIGSKTMFGLFVELEFL